MTWSADDEYRTRVLSRDRVVLMLRHPGLAYGAAALVLMYAGGLVAATSAAELAGADAATLLAPAAGATAACALFVGSRLLRHEDSDASAVVSRSALVWAIMGAGWALMLAAPEIVENAAGSFSRLGEGLIASVFHAVAGALVGGLGGIVGATAAVLLCIERRA